MSVVYVSRTSTEGYLCLSGDTKPATASKGAKAYETDTGDVYLFNGTSWVLIGDASFVAL